MTKLYHYITKGNNALKQGILSFANNPQADLHYYYKRTGGETTHSGIVKWMENCFEGRSRAIRGFSEPIQWTEKSINMFKPFIANADLFSVDLETLQKDGLIEAIYVSPAIRPNLDKDFPQDVDERLVRLASIRLTLFCRSVLSDRHQRRHHPAQIYYIGILTIPKDNKLLY